MPPPNLSPQPPIQALVNLLHSGQYDLLARQAVECTARWPNSAPLWHLLGLAHLSAGRPQEAAQAINRAAKLLPQDGEIQEHLAIALMQSGRGKEALRAFDRCLALAPKNLGALINAASLANDQGAHGNAEKHCRQALKLAPQQAEALFNLGRAQRGLGRQAEAIASFRAVAALTLEAAEAQNDIGLQLLDLGASVDAESCLRRAIQLAPDYAFAHSNLGKLLESQGHADAALAAFRRATELAPQLPGPLANIGGLLNALRQFREAEIACRKAIALEANFLGALTNLGCALQGQQQLEAAEACYRQVLKADPANSDARNNLGNLMLELQRFDLAESCFRLIKDDHGYALGQAFHCASYLCDWRLRAKDTAALQALLKRDDTYLDPFGLLSLQAPDTPGLQKRAAWLAARNHYGAALRQPPLVAPETHTPRERLRIGYLSADFHNHATMHLLGGVLQAHDASRYTIQLYSYGPAAQDASRQLAEANCAGFHDLRELTDQAAAQRIAADGLDILVDLKGYTRDSRLGITALRPAPIIVSWLGYPGTLGDARLADYIIGDPVVTPPEHAAHFSETLALLPHCYQPNNRGRQVGPRPSRQEAGLPEQGFVFCSFNQSYKLNPEVFALWCTLLKNVPGSVLWLLQASAATESHLQREAATRGVEPKRLIFAPHKPLEEHLARLQWADLALDTSPYGSHTTGSDALWVGVPLVSKIGESFASRVGASLLHAVGLSELVAEDWQTYLSLAQGLAENSARLAALKEKLVSERLQVPLFDTEGFTRNLENLYQRMWAQHASGCKEILLPQV